MSQATLSASLTRDKGSRNSRRLRASGSIPAVVYGGGGDTLSISVDAKSFRTAVSGDQGLNSLISLDAEGQTFLVMAREIQRHPVRGTVSHTTEAGAIAHIDSLAKKYLGKDVYPWHNAKDVRVTYEIEPLSVQAMG